MADINRYLVEIDTEQELSDWELDELRQLVVDYLSPSEDTTVEVTELDL